LLPVRGRPIADHVIQALEQSDVEKIFVVQDDGAALQEALSPTSKSVFLTKDGHSTKLGMGSLLALEKVAEYYGNAELSKRSIMVVPCDIPLVTSADFNALIGKASGKCADVIMTIIAVKRLEERFPHKHFRSVYLTDYQARYTMQNVLFLNGEFIQFDPMAEQGKLKFSFRGWDADVLKRVKDGIDSIDALRHQSLFHDKLFLLWLLTKGYTYYIFRLLVDLFFRRLTMEKVIQYLNGADHMQSDYIESQQVEFSADIDSPEDFQMVLGEQWQNNA
jgi:GTP:adenosylcobinamide-phosphate guanylyltransferase